MAASATGSAAATPDDAAAVDAATPRPHRLRERLRHGVDDERHLRLHERHRRAASRTDWPRAVSAANGIRNFSDAASHSQYRTWARLRLNASVSSPASAATSVDCQR